MDRAAKAIQRRATARKSKPRIDRGPRFAIPAVCAAVGVCAVCVPALAGLTSTCVTMAPGVLLHNTAVSHSAVTA